MTSPPPTAARGPRPPLIVPLIVGCILVAAVYLLWPKPQQTPSVTGNGFVNAAAFSRDGDRVITGDDGGVIRIWNSTTGRQIGPSLTGHSDQVTCVLFSPDGKLVVSGSADHSVRVWDATTGQEIGAPLLGLSGPVDAMAVSPDGKYLAAAADLNTTAPDQRGGIIVWDLATHKAVGAVPEASAIALGFTSDGARLFAVTGSDVLVIDPAAGRQLSDTPLDIDRRETRYLYKGYSVTDLDAVRSAAISPDGKLIVTGLNDGTVRFWDASTGQSLDEPLQGHTDPVTSLAFSPDSARVASGSQDDTIRTWDARTRQPLGAPLAVHKDWVNSVAFSADGARIVSASGDRTARVWDATSGKEIGPPLTSHLVLWGVVF